MRSGGGDTSEVPEAEEESSITCLGPLRELASWKTTGSKATLPEV